MRMKPDTFMAHHFLTPNKTCYTSISKSTLNAHRRGGSGEWPLLLEELRLRARSFLSFFFFFFLSCFSFSFCTCLRSSSSSVRYLVSGPEGVGAEPPELCRSRLPPDLERVTWNRVRRRNIHRNAGTIPVIQGMIY